LNSAKLALKVILGIATRNRSAPLQKAIESALAQNYPNIRIFVRNDGSTDGTATLATRYPNVNWINCAEPRGYVAARNDFMSNSDADYFVSLDDDAWFLKGDEIAAGLDFLEKRPDVAVAGFDVLSPGNERPRDRAEPILSPTFIGCGHIVRLAAIRETGGYETTPGGYGGEEKDLSLRLMDAGYKIVSMPGVHVWHDKTPVARNQMEQHRSGVCNDFVMTYRRTPLPVLPIAFLAKFYKHFQFSRTHQLEVPFWEGLRLFLQSIPKLRKSRNPVRLTTLRAYLKLSNS
jgi:glycosyltransferase involved in cell wall biosynthesis